MNNMNGKHLLLFQTNQNKCTRASNWLGGVALQPSDRTTPMTSVLHPSSSALYPSSCIPRRTGHTNLHKLQASCVQGESGGKGGRGEEQWERARQLRIETKCERRKVPTRRGPSKGVAFAVKWENDTLYFTMPTLTLHHGKVRYLLTETGNLASTCLD